MTESVRGQQANGQPEGEIAMEQFSPYQEQKPRIKGSTSNWDPSNLLPNSASQHHLQSAGRLVPCLSFDYQA